MRKSLCRSGKKKKNKKRVRNRSQAQQPEASSKKLFPEGGVSWMEKDGLHALLPGEKPSEEEVRKMTERYRRELRKSPLFKQWVQQYGKKRAVEMLKECRVEIR